MLSLEQILIQLGAMPEVSARSNAPPARAPLPPGRTTPPSSPAGVGAGTQVRSQPATQEKFVSPFEADRTRKSRSFDPEMSSSQSPSVAVTATAIAEVNGAVTINGVHPGNHAVPRNGAHPVNGSDRPSEASPSITADPETSADAGGIL